MMRRIILLLAFLSYGCLANTQTFVINTPLLKSHQTARIQNMLVILTEAFNALDIEVEFRYRPDKRSIAEANDGLVDGEFARIATIVEQFPNLVVVHEPLAHGNLVAFTLCPTIDFTHYQLTQHEYTIGYLAGWANATALLKNYSNQVAVAEYDVLFKLLANNRVDLVIYTQAAGDKILRSMKIDNYQTSSSLMPFTVYLLLNKKHANLASKLANEIKIAKLKHLQ